MAKHEPRVALAHMKDSLAAIAEYTSEGRDECLIHHYFGVDLDTVWNVIEQDVPQLRTDIWAMLESLAD